MGQKCSCLIKDNDFSIVLRQNQEFLANGKDSEKKNNPNNKRDSLYEGFDTFAKTKLQKNVSEISNNNKNNLSYEPNLNSPFPDSSKSTAINNKHNSDMNVSKFSLNSKDNSNKIIIGTGNSFVFKKNSVLGDVDFKILNHAQGKKGFENLSFNEIIDMKNNNKKRIMKLVASVYGWFYRIKFAKGIKENLLMEQNIFYEKYKKNYSALSKVFLDIENFYKKTFDCNRWKEFYTEKEYITDFSNEESYRKSFYTKILISWGEDNKQNYYNGFLNIYNQKNGKGVLITKEAKFEGYWLNDELHGWSMITNSDGFIYEGLYKNNLLNGKGIINGNEGKYYYCGDFRNGIKNGFGKETTTDYIYSGHFSNDKKNGKGKLVFKATHDSYEGNFIDNQMTGSGYYIWANKDSYKGTFINGKMDGKGVYRWKNGRIYEGAYKNGVKEGLGVLKDNMNVLYEGEFKNGVPEGDGFVYKNGVKTRIRMEGGKISKNIDSCVGLTTDATNRRDNLRTEKSRSPNKSPSFNNKTTA